MDYSIFKPGDKVRGVGGYKRTGTVLFARHDLLVIEETKGGPCFCFYSLEFEKVPERTSKFTNVYLISDSVYCSTSRYTSADVARQKRSTNESYIGMFEQVFEGGKLVETKYHSDA